MWNLGGFVDAKKWIAGLYINYLILNENLTRIVFP